MSDASFLDERYFVGNDVYNCPFCNRRHVTFSIYDQSSFDWSQNRTCYVYFVKCRFCSKKSMHLSYQHINTDEVSHYLAKGRLFNLQEGNLDDLFFYSVPTSFFSLDTRVPRQLRELMIEAEGCLKSNFLTGASACARKIIYELSVLHEIDETRYEDRIKLLKEKHHGLEPTFFDTLLTIQQVTSSKVHENSYDGWESKHVRVILASLREVLHEIYVVPALRQDRRTEVLKLKSELLEENAPSPRDNNDTVDSA